jgi:hypothetical protein
MDRSRDEAAHRYKQLNARAASSKPHSFWRQSPSLQDLLATVNFVVGHPFSGKPVSALVQKFSIRTFRYSLIYVIDEPEIVIVAVAHHRRRPGYWPESIDAPALENGARPRATMGIEATPLQMCARRGWT